MKQKDYKIQKGRKKLGPGKGLPQNRMRMWAFLVNIPGLVFSLRLNYGHYCVLVGIKNEQIQPIEQNNLDLDLAICKILSLSIDRRAQQA